MKKKTGVGHFGREQHDSFYHVIRSPDYISAGTSYLERTSFSVFFKLLGQ